MQFAIGRNLGAAARYGLLAFAAIWVTWTAADISRLPGWLEAQGGNFYFPAIVLACIATGFAWGGHRTRNGKSGAIAVALIVLAFCEICWIGSTR